MIASEGALRGLAGWYMAIERPKWSLHPSLYSPLWTVLFGLSGFAAWRLLRQDNEQKTVTLVLLAVTLGLSALWPWLFFDLQLTFASVIVSGALCFTSLLACGLSFRVSRTAGWLLTPLLLWTLFATATNIEIWRLNTTQQPTKSAK